LKNASAFSADIASARWLRRTLNQAAPTSTTGTAIPMITAM